MPAKRPARRPAKNPVRRGATGARAAAKLAQRARKAKPAKKAAKRPAKPAKKAPKKAARKAAKRPAKAPKRAKKATKSAQSPKKSARAQPVEFTEVPHSTKRLRIALFGASGNLGSRILKEATRRGHQVTALVRNPDKVSTADPNVRAVRGDVTDPLQVEVVARNHDVVVSAISPPPGDPDVLVEAAQSLLSGARATGKRVVAVGGAGSLEVSPGVQLLDTPAFPAAWRPVASAHRDALGVFRKEGGSGWTVVSPAALIEPGERTGRFRLGEDALLKDAKGDSRITMEDFAVAVVDELETRRSPGKRITVGY